MSKIACKIPGEAKLTSATRRLSRLLDNPAIRVRKWQEPIARQWLEAWFRNEGEIHLIVDGTKIGYGNQMLMIALDYRKRSIRIALAWEKHVRGHSQAGKHLALLACVRKLLPKGAAVFLVGDCEFGSVEVLRQLGKWHWFYVLRQKPETSKEIYPTHLLVHWHVGEEQAGCLAANLPYQQMALRLSSPALAVALVYVWLFSVGGRTIRDGLRHSVDRVDCRDLSIFPSDLRFIQWRLTKALPFRISLYSYL